MKEIKESESAGSGAETKESENRDKDGYTASEWEAAENAAITFNLLHKSAGNAGADVGTEASDGADGGPAAVEDDGEEEERPGLIEFEKPYRFEGKEYTSIDLSGVAKLTIADAAAAQSRLIESGDPAASLVTERSTAFAMEIAALGCVPLQPREFFKLMPRGKAKAVQRYVISELRLTNDDTSGKNVMKFKKPYTFNGKTYESVDLSGLADMTSMNEMEAENRLTRGGVTYIDPAYCYMYNCIMASMATGLPEEFFTGLPFGELLNLKAAVNNPDFLE